ncbi:hypothetical protein AVEN_152979-1 [Araneus ventricosus]|uniref:Uncharacterized protein n=1 Tax=Araneus ventricosus TaxID=182803 RepID=A0A4Y2AEM7_ARAVE|nr:hypothetical protein AVEN_152979-1 [Araneus ventricosus]
MLKNARKLNLERSESHQIAVCASPPVITDSVMWSSCPVLRVQISDHQMFRPLSIRSKRVIQTVDLEHVTQFGRCVTPSCNGHSMDHGPINLFIG